VLVALALLGAGAAGAVPVSSLTVQPAYAGQWVQVACANPFLTPASSEGWSSFVTGIPGGSSSNSTDCPANTAMYADLEPTSGDDAPVGSAETLQYTPPPGSTLTGGYIDVNIQTGGGGAPSGAATVYTATSAGGASDTFLQCDASTDSCNGAAGNGFSGVVALPADRGGNLYLSASCNGNQGQSCNLLNNGAWSSVRLVWAHLLLTNNSSPTASAFSGSLLAPDAHGTTNIAFTADDQDGPGIYQATIEIDGNAVYDATPDTNGGECVPVDAFPTETPLMFDWQQPCPQNEPVDIPVNTSALSDGEHNLKVIITDAAQNVSTVLDQTITTLNHPTTSAPSSSPAPQTPRTATAATPPSASAAPPVYTLSLGPATRALASGITRPYNDSAVQLAGTVKTQAGAAASGVPITLWAKAANSGTYKQLAHTTTNSSGAWTLKAPPGPSRLLSVTTGLPEPPVRANAAVSVRETVTPTLSLNVATPGSATLIFTGQLSIAPLGKPRPLVIIETPGPSGWEAVGTPIRVDQHGRFRYAYRSSPLTLNRSFQFRAVTPATALWQRGQSPDRTAVIR